MNTGGRGVGSFADFFNHASEAERAELFAKVLDGATLAQRMVDHGCRKPVICNMDYDRSWDAAHPDKRINRLCSTCYRHWAGPVGAVKEYTRKEWDAEVARAFAQDSLDPPA